MIRYKEMEEQDVENMRDLFIEHFLAADMYKRGYTFEWESSRETALKFAREDMFKTLIAMENESYVGVIVFCILPSLFNRQEFRASELLWYAISPRVFIKLFKLMEQELIEEGINCINIGLPAKNKVEKFLARNGYVRFDVSFGKEVNKDV